MKLHLQLTHLSHSHPLFSSHPLLRWRNLPELRLPLSPPRCLSPPNSAPFNGWDDHFRIRIPPTENSGESNLIPTYLRSVGIDDKKYVIVYVLGFVCALAVSRVRVPSILALPAVAIVFAIGFSFGALNGRPSGFKLRKSFSGDKLRDLVKLFDEFDGRNGKLKDRIGEALRSRRVGVDDLKGYVDGVELMGLCVRKARNVVEEIVIECDSVEGNEADRNSRKKANRKRKEAGDNGFNWFKLGFGFFGDNTKSNKKKEGVKNEANNVSRDDLVDEGRVVNSKYANSSRRQNRRDLESEGGRSDGVARNGSFGFMEVNKSREVSQSRVNESFLDNGGREVNVQSDRLRFTDDRKVTFRMSEYGEIGHGVSHDTLDDDLLFTSNLRNVKKHRNFSGAFESSRYGLEGGYESYGKDYREETDTKGNLLENNDQSTQEVEFVSSLSSSEISGDILFDKYLTEANGLLKQAKDYSRIRDNEMRVDRMLDESAKLLSGALSLKPMSLLATGLLGNTYLLRGELKLRFSQELRYLLSGSDGLGADGWNDILLSKDEPPPSKDKIVSRLIDVCEECEELLVEAGRKYRMALSIDGNDVRALYNWGVALSFRAQLIADIGPESASDADKLFLAAIDKFDAMMSRSKTYAPDALYRWAMVLQQRSRLRPRNSKDKVRLLQQAKRLYEDALDMGFDKLQAKETLSSPIYEFNPGQ